MNYSKILSLAAASILAALSIVPYAAALQTGTEPEDEGAALVGTWTVQVTRQDCQTHAPLGPPFLSLLTFNLAGTLTETTSNPQFGVTMRGPGHGAWKRTGGGNYKALSAAFVTTNGDLISTQYLTQYIHLTGPDDYIVPSSSVRFVSPAGVVLSTGCAVAVGKRLEVE